MPCFVRLRYLFGLDVPVGVRRNKELLGVNLIAFSVHIMLFGLTLAQSNLLSLRLLILKCKTVIWNRPSTGMCLSS